MEEVGLVYQVQRYNSEWNEILDDQGNLIYLANKFSRLIFRVKRETIRGSGCFVLGKEVTGQFEETETEALCNGHRRTGDKLG